MAASWWVTHLHSAQGVAEGQANLLFGWELQKGETETPARFLSAAEARAHGGGWPPGRKPGRRVSDRAG